MLPRNMVKSLHFIWRWGTHRWNLVPDLQINCPNSQITRCASPISHNAPFRTNGAHFCSEWCIVGYGRGIVELWIRSKCIVGFVRLITFRELTKLGTMIVVSVMAASVTSAITIIWTHRLQRNSRVPLIPTMNRVLFYDFMMYHLQGVHPNDYACVLRFLSFTLVGQWSVLPISFMITSLVLGPMCHCPKVSGANNYNKCKILRYQL